MLINLKMEKIKIKLTHKFSKIEEIELEDD